jgi:hypothetical protein
MKRPSLLDPSFRYVPSHASDISKTFARIRREQREAAAKSAATHEFDIAGTTKVASLMAARVKGVK